MFPEKVSLFNPEKKVTGGAACVFVNSDIFPLVAPVTLIAPAI